MSMNQQPPGVRVIRCTPGESLDSALERVRSEAGAEAVHARAFGTISGVEVLLPDGEGVLSVLRHDATAELVQCDALASEDGVHCSGVVSLVVGGVPLTIGGRLRIAAALDVTLVIHVVGASDVLAASVSMPESPSRGPVVVERGGSAAGAREPAAAAPRASSGGRASGAAAVESSLGVSGGRAAGGGHVGGGSGVASGQGAWARVAAVSATVQGAEDDDDDEVDADDLERGDVLLHPKLGRCRVLGQSGVDAVRVQVPSGSPRKLMMRPFRIFRCGDTREFELRRRED